MNRLLRALAIFTRHVRWSAPPDWSEADGRALAGFLASPAGAKLREILRSEIASANERAAMSKGAAFECGWACGYRGLYAWFESLAQVMPPQGHEHVTDDDEDPLSQLIP